MCVILGFQAVGQPGGKARLLPRWSEKVLHLPFQITEEVLESGQGF